MTSFPTSQPPLQPSSKAASTAQSSQQVAIGGQNVTPRRSTSPPRRSKPTKLKGSVNDFLSEKATLSLIRRVLVADATDSRATPQPIEAILPPLTSSNDADVQLYAIIAIIIKDFVQTWYSKITPDHAFVEDVIQIIAHCSRAIEERLRQVDVLEIILDEIPVLVQRHVESEYNAPSMCLLEASLIVGRESRVAKDRPLTVLTKAIGSRLIVSGSISGGE
jgi:PXA domain